MALLDWMDKLQTTLFSSKESRWEKYKNRRWKYRYKRFNDRDKHPRIHNWRYQKDMKYLEKYGVNERASLPIDGSNSLLFNSFWNAKNRMWYEIIINWLFWISIGILVIYDVTFIFDFKHMQAAQMIILTGSMCLIIVFLSVFKFWWRIAPPKKKYQQNGRNMSFGSNYRKTRRNRSTFN